MTKPGAILLIHGSKYGRGGEQADADGSIYAEKLKQFLPYFKVTWCCLEFGNRRILEAVYDLVAAGCKEIVIAPYFLFEGSHITNDLPEEVGKIRKKFPAVEIIIAEKLGYQESQVFQMAINIMKAYHPDL